MMKPKLAVVPPAPHLTVRRCTKFAPDEMLSGRIQTMKRLLEKGDARGGFLGWLRKR